MLTVTVPDGVPEVRAGDDLADLLLPVVELADGDVVVVASKVVSKAEGRVMVQAFCPGSTKGWLAIGPIAHQRDLRVHAFGQDAAGETRLCAVMDFTWRGEWRMPNPNTSDVTARVMRPDYIKTPGS